MTIMELCASRPRFLLPLTPFGRASEKERGPAAVRLTDIDGGAAMARPRLC